MKHDFHLVAIDPSLHSTGIVVFNKDEEPVLAHNIVVPKDIKGVDAIYKQASLLDVFLFNNMIHYQPARMVVEKQVYRKDERMGINSFLDLFSVSYVIVPIHLRHLVTFVTPVEWKGQLPKPICHRRLLKKEKNPELFQNNSDILDALGIGRWYYENAKTIKVS